jgi:hypothetical protein
MKKKIAKIDQPFGARKKERQFLPNFIDKILYSDISGHVFIE